MSACRRQHYRRGRMGDATGRLREPAALCRSALAREALNPKPTSAPGLDPSHFAPNSAMAAAKALPTHFQAEPIQ